MARMSAQSGVTTADELLGLPRGTWRYELVDGALRRMTPAGHVHGRIAAEIGADLTTFVRRAGLGKTYAAETGFLLRRSPDTVRAPDAAFVSHERLASMVLESRGFFPGPPDLAIEVLSPSDSRREVDDKVADWVTSGCRAVIVLDPDHRLAVIHRPHLMPERVLAPASITLPDLLPGWEIGLADLFR